MAKARKGQGPCELRPFGLDGGMDLDCSVKLLLTRDRRCEYRTEPA